ncbi:hypothetical protein [Oryzibacter oryziterrae]|uniref:hypothetical protein n=1 Tax=Oryzibacter oryziterrae TaxID=2766474 RepID=UPI001F465B2E|nr:hypothetical protein [Oryzibacter oryziterrae]
MSELNMLACSNRQRAEVLVGEPWNFESSAGKGRLTLKFYGKFVYNNKYYSIAKCTPFLWKGAIVSKVFVSFRHIPDFNSNDYQVYLVFHVFGKRIRPKDISFDDENLGFIIGGLKLM